MALITGSYGGLGTCFVNIHAGDGGNLILVGRNQKKLDEQADSIRKMYDVEVHTIAADLSSTDAAKVRSALTELLPGGGGTADGVAEKLGISKRTLQRKLAEEDTSFQKQLNGVRELLTKHYIKNTDMSTDDISFLLGYQELNSFLRAFSIWTGISVSEYKKICNQGGIV